MEQLNTQESFKVIQSIINQRKKKFEENGHFLLLWGAVITLASLAHFTLAQMGKPQHIAYAWMITIPVAIYSFVSGFANGRKKAKNHQSPDWTGWLWAVAGILAFATGFFFGNKFHSGFTAMLMIPFCLAGLSSALSIKNKNWAILSILGLIIAYASIFAHWEVQPLFIAVVTFLVFVIPGLQLYMNHKKQHNV